MQLSLTRSGVRRKPNHDTVGLPSQTTTCGTVRFVLDEKPCWLRSDSNVSRAFNKMKLL